MTSPATPSPPSSASEISPASARRSSKRRSRPPAEKEAIVPTSKFAIASLVCLLGNILIFTALRLREIIITSGLIMIVATIGFVLGAVALKRLHRRKGRLQGEGAALIGKFVNLGLAGLAAVLFVYSVAMAVLRGQLLN